MIRTGVHDPAKHGKAWQAVVEVWQLWDKGNWFPKRTDVILAGRKFLLLLKDKGMPVPNDSYIDGEVDEMIFEWQYPDDVIVRLWIQGAYFGELMTTYGDGRPTEWKTVQWPDMEIIVSEEVLNDGI